MKPRKWTDEKLALEALKYKRRWEFQKKSPQAYKAAWRRGLEFLNRI